MSSELAERQKEDVAKLLARGNPNVFSDFATFTKVLDIREEGDDVVLHIRAITFYRNDANPDMYSGTATDRYFTFKRMRDRWVLTDVKLTSAGTMPPDDEPGVAPNEKGTSRVLAETPEWPATVPIEIKRLDQAATEIKNEWAIDEKAAENYSQK